MRQVERATIAIYAGSFDPFTFGHLEVAMEAMRLFKKVVIAVGRNERKEGLYKAEERVEIIRDYLKKVDAKAVHVTTFSGLLSNFAQEWTHERVALIRGLRAVSDFESEMAMAAANRKLNERMSTVFVPTPPHVAFISSSVVKEIARNTRRIQDLRPYVSDPVAKSLIGRLQPVPDWIKQEAARAAASPLARRSGKAAKGRLKKA